MRWPRFPFRQLSRKSVVCPTVEVSPVDGLVSRYHDDVVGERELRLLGELFWRGCKIAPLLEVEGDTSLCSEVAESTDPIRVHRSGPSAAFPADDYPVDAIFLCVKTEIERTEQRLA